MVKILHGKILNAIYLSWFHSNTSEINNFVNGHSNEPSLPKKENFPLRISSVNETKSEGNYGFGHIYRWNP